MLNLAGKNALRCVKLRWLVCLAALGVPALAQNNDLSVMAGILTGEGTAISVPGVRQSSDLALAGEITYGRRLLDTGPVAVELELPFVGSAADRVKILADSASAASGTAAFAPGLRLRPAGGFRLSPFVSAGFGPAWVESTDVRLDPSPALTVNDGLTPVFSVAAGLDLRIVRHFGVRGQVRDLMLVGDAGRGDRHRLMFTAGFSIRW